MVVPMFEGIVSKYEEEVSRFGDVAMTMVYVICAVIAFNVLIIAVFVLRALVNHIQTLQHKFVCCCVALTLPASSSLVLFKHFKNLENDWRDLNAGEGGDQTNLEVRVLFMLLHTCLLYTLFQKGRKVDLYLTMKYLEF